MNIRKLSDLKLDNGSDVPLNVCVVSSEFVGPVKNGGIATATSGLIRELAADGHNVTLLYTLVERGEPASGERSWHYWVDALAATGVDLKYIPHDGDYIAWRAKSWRVKEFIRNENFDVVYFNEHHGSAYYSLAAKRAGLEPFANQLHCVIAHGSMEWVFDVNHQYAIDPADIELMSLERRSVEWADVVIGPSHYLLQQYEKYGWQLPEQTFQQFYPLFKSSLDRDRGPLIPITELVFFGRLEVRKGLWLFCQALDLLSERLAGKTVTFLGRMTDSGGMSSGLQLINKTSKWPFRVNVITDFDALKARAYLRGLGRLAVMPSLADNSPCVVYECIEDGIPFVTTRGSGTDELVDPDSWAEAMVEPDAAALAARLDGILDGGARVGRPRYNPPDNLVTWSKWHRYLAKNRAELIRTSPLTQKLARVATPARHANGEKRPLMVILDRGHCSLSLLVNNLSSHLTRFGDRIGCLVLSSRGGELLTAVHELFGSAPVAIAAPQAIDEARELILGAPVVFFLDAEIEISTPFFVLALGSLTEQRAAAVSCVVAVTSTDSEEAQVEELPAGDVPGLGALGEPIGSAVWAVSTKSVAEELAALEIYDKQTDDLVSSSSLGQWLLQRCRLAKKPFYLLPMVGGTILRDEHASSAKAAGQFKQTKSTATDLGISPSIYDGGAPWFAMTKFGAAAQPADRGSGENVLALPAEHPLSGMQENGQATDLAELAAALGRCELSIQIEAAAGGSVDRVRQLTELAAKSIRLRPTADLSKVLAAGSIIEFGRTPIPVRLEEETQLPPRKITRKASGTRVPKTLGEVPPEEKAVETKAAATKIGGGIATYVDGRRLRVRGNHIRALDNLAKLPGKLFFFDVPLCGNSLLVATLSCAGSSALDITMKAFDQRNGDLIGAASGRIDKKKPSDLWVSLDQVFGWATVQIELAGPAQAEVAIDALQVQ